MHAPLVVIAFVLATGGVEGNWQAVELSTTENGMVNLLADGLTVDLELHNGNFRFVFFDSDRSGKVKLDAGAGRIDLVGEDATWFGSYALDDTGSKLTIGLWERDNDRQAMPPTAKGGLVLVFKRR
jgi:hypothetical protein